MNTVTDEQYKQAKELFLSGKNLRETSDILNINRKKLSKKLREDGYKTDSHISEEKIQKAIELYNNGYSLMKITRELKLDKNTLSKQLEKRGIRKRKKRGRKYTQFDNQILEYYKNNESIYNISLKFGISTNAVTNCLIDHNVLDSNRTTRSNKYDKNIFKMIDTEEKAYWLGFLYADGYVDINKGIELTLKADDLEHIEKFKAFMKSNHKISYRKNVNAYRICITSQELAQDLTNLGCYQAKSLTLKFPTKEQVPEHLIHHFMRGYFDGDGCICMNKKQLIFSVLGTKEFLDKYEKIILNVLNKNKPNKRHNDGKAYNIRYGGNKQCEKIFDFLYKDATIYLKRKYDKFIAVLGQSHVKA